MTAPTGPPPPAPEGLAPDGAAPDGAAPEGAAAPGAPADLRVVVDLHAERLSVGLVERPYRRVRVRREVVTEEVSVRVTVRREVLRIEHEDLLEDAPATPSGGSRTPPPPIELVLHEERPVVGVEVVPVERVTVRAVRREVEAVVGAALRHEELDVDVTGVRVAGVDDAARPGRPRGTLRP